MNCCFFLLPFHLFPLSPIFVWAPLLPPLSLATPSLFLDLAWLLDQIGQNPIYHPLSNSCQLTLLHLALRLHPCPLPPYVSLFSKHALRPNSTSSSPAEDVSILWFFGFCLLFSMYFFFKFFLPVFSYILVVFVACNKALFSWWFVGYLVLVKTLNLWMKTVSWLLGKKGWVLARGFFAPRAEE